MWRKQLKSLITYFTGGNKYTIPFDFALSYGLTILRFLFASFVISYYFALEYTVLTMSLAVLLADFRFYLDFNQVIEELDEEDEDDF